ncbi:hypothetical protein CPS_1566 [Colwellia psychrerythraea 34H]|uniref:Uncharacterized protein n=1 Tax=Colwellia psychrerythraea (strain 34H / ATCC BAA-681) TaxID=167879 RepID=Q485F7_COLP3|nr:hypothetical protein CPS_1566 [Colwellia psychrerythraea 34H]
MPLIPVPLLYPSYLNMQVSAGIRKPLSKALIEEKGCSLVEINNAA